MNIWQSMEGDRQREIARDAAARAGRTTLPAGVVLRAHLLEGGPYLVLLTLGLSGYLWWAGGNDPDQAWGIWGNIVAVSAFGMPLLTARDVGDRMPEGDPGRFGLALSWAVIVAGTVIAITVPTLVFGPGLAEVGPFEGDPLRIVLVSLTPLLAGLTLMTLLLQLWHLPLWVNGLISVSLIVASLASMGPLSWVAYGTPPPWVETVAVYGGLGFLPLCVLGLALVPRHRVAAVGEYGNWLP